MPVHCVLKSIYKLFYERLNYNYLNKNKLSIDVDMAFSRALGEESVVWIGFEKCIEFVYK